MTRLTIVAILLVSFSGCGKSKAKARRDGLGNVAALPMAKELPTTDSLNWMTWRGPNRNGHAVNQSPPIDWSEDNILWKSKVPGRGHSSPIVVADRIFVTSARTASENDSAEMQSVHCYDRLTGDERWSNVVHEGGLPKRIHISNSHASHSMVSDGKSVFCLFINKGKVELTKLSLDGKQLWQRELGQFRSDFGFGSGASPIYWDSKLIVTSECATDSFIVALDPDDGSEIWRIDRPASTSYSTPVVANVAGKFQMLIGGMGTVKAYDPQSGTELWSVDSDWQVCCGTMVWHDDIVFASGGFPNAQTIAIRADGSGEVLWKNKAKCYEQSMIVVDGCVFGLSDNGVCYCWDAVTGNENWKQRMEDKVSASPIYAGGHIYFTTERGSCFVIKPNAKQCDVIARNQLGSSTFATPVMVDNKIYARVGEDAGANRQEWVYCIGKQ